MTILHVYHAAGVGGVASYLCHLTAQLIQRGHRLVYAGPGGPLTAKLERAGVKCRFVAIKDWRLLQTRRELAAIIRQESVELVCAHDYSAGAAACLATRCAGVPYLLTVHCIRPFWQRFVTFYWSDPVLTVSAGLRDHLVRTQKLPAERVLETVNGIDADYFSSRHAMPTDCPVILHVSRLSVTKCPVALALVVASTRLSATVPGLKMMIVGGGECESKVRRVAERANRRLGRAVVEVLGPRDDVKELLQTADVVVGTGLFALEAMACQRAVVAAGKCGFIGPVTPATFGAARAAHFGDHFAPLTATPERLAHAILSFLSNSQLSQDVGVWGRQMVRQHFSMEHVVEQLEGVYRAKLTGRTSPLPASSVQCRNLGSMQTA